MFPQDAPWCPLDAPHLLLLATMFMVSAIVAVARPLGRVAGTTSAAEARCDDEWSAATPAASGVTPGGLRHRRPL